MLAQISIHPPRVGWDSRLLEARCKSAQISIHPPRVGWDEGFHMLPLVKPISIHPPRVGWDHRVCCGDPTGHISIHPPRVGWDLLGGVFPHQRQDFNPPTPCGVGLHPVRALSIRRWDFNPPTPCGVGLSFAMIRAGYGQFQSTHPVWGGTHQYRRSVP